LFGHGQFYLGLIEALLGDGFAVEVKVGVKISGNQFFAYAKAFFQLLDCACLVEFLGVDVICFKAELAQVAGCFGPAVIG